LAKGITNGVVATDAVAAYVTWNMMGGTNPVTFLVLLYIPPDGSNYTCNFMAQDQRCFVKAVPLQQIGATDAAGLHPHQYLAGADLWHRHLLQPHILIVVIHSYAHEILSYLSNIPKSVNQNWFSI
jgi:hypothetical protein